MNSELKEYDLYDSIEDKVKRYNCRFDTKNGNWKTLKNVFDELYPTGDYFEMFNNLKRLSIVKKTRLFGETVNYISEDSDFTHIIKQKIYKNSGKYYFSLLINVDDEEGYKAICELLAKCV